jgi:hypothetical protein
VFFSVAELGGSASLSIRLSEGRRSTDLPAPAWEPDGAIAWRRTSLYPGIGRVNHPRVGDEGEGEKLNDFN